MHARRSPHGAGLPGARAEEEPDHGDAAGQEREDAPVRRIGLERLAGERAAEDERLEAVPDVDEAVHHADRDADVAGAAQTPTVATPPRAPVVGAPLLLGVGADTARLDVDRPGGRRSVLEGEELAEHKQVRFADTNQPGFYRVSEVLREGASSARSDSSFAVNLDPRGSDLHRADLTELTRAPRTAASSGSDSREHRVELWHAVAAALLLFLLVESILVWRR